VKPKPPADLWDKMDALNKTNGYTPCDVGFTVTEYADRYGFTNGIARNRLKSMSERGQLIKGHAIRDGKVCIVFRFPDDDERDSTHTSTR
jgi:hypothetical protein